MTHDEQFEILNQKYKSAIEESEKDKAGCPVVWVKRDNAIEVLKHLKTAEGLEYEFLADLTAYDEKGSREEERCRFVMVYNLYSPAYKLRLRVKVRLQENETMPTLTDVWTGANWAEREVFDMFGIKFDRHPDLRRILMDVRWVGHPLRKDYPLRKYQLFTEPEEMPVELLKKD